MDSGQYFPVWARLSPEQQGALRASASERHFKKGALIHGGAADCVGFILVVSGQLRVFTVSDEGRELTLYRLDAVMNGELDLLIEPLLVHEQAEKLQNREHPE